MDNKDESPKTLTLKDTRKSVPFFTLGVSEPIERNVIESNIEKTSVENLKKKVFRCQPKSKDPNHTSLENITKNTAVKEIIYRVIVNNRGKMKLEDIVEQTLGILKGRRLSGIRENQDIHDFFYKLIKDDTEYGFEEIE